jgi:hypothetical protein
MPKQEKTGYAHDGRDALAITPIPENPLKKGRGGAPMVPPPKSPAPAKAPTPPPAEKK